MTWLDWSLNLLGVNVSEKSAPGKGRSISILNLCILLGGTAGSDVPLQRFRYFLFYGVKWLESTGDRLVICVRNYPRVSCLLIAAAAAIIR